LAHFCLILAALVSLGLTPQPYRGATPQPAGKGTVPVKDVTGTVPALEIVARDATTLPRLHSLLVSRQGKVQLERYFNGARATRLANVKSVSKSIISALVGIAIERKLIAGVNQPIGSFFTTLLARDVDAPKRAITIEDLLTMRSGLESTSNRNYGAWVQSANWVRFALARPLQTTPGREMEYSTGNTHLLSAILHRVTGTDTWRFANAVLAKPLGFTLAQWPRDPQGIYFGGNEMLLTPRQMLAFGELYLNDGRVRGSGTRVLDENWIEDSWKPRGRSDYSNREYGYGWWMRELGGRQTYYAWGYGGQFIFVVPDLEMVVVTTSAANVATDRRDHRDAIYSLVERIIASS
jgi:CubicO group peptidase (beta-lactamase class C family)